MRGIENHKILTISFLFLIAIFWVGILFTVVTNAIPYNSTSTQMFNKDYVIFRALLPEGFSFFTRDPREPLVVLYSKDKSEVELHNNHLSYLFGFNRYPRAANMELSIVWQAVKDQAWYNCEVGDGTCFDDDLIPHYTIKNSFKDPFLVGEFYLKVVEPIPWAWARSFKENRKSMPCKVIRITINSHDDK